MNNNNEHHKNSSKILACYLVILKSTFFWKFTSIKVLVICGKGNEQRNIWTTSKTLELSKDETDAMQNVGHVVDHVVNIRTFWSICALQMGHWESWAAHLAHEQTWPQGRNTTFLCCLYDVINRKTSNSYRLCLNLTNFLQYHAKIKELVNYYWNNNKSLLCKKTLRNFK